MAWYDLYKLWTYATAKDPQSHKRDQDFGGAGVTQPDAVPDIRADGSFWGGGRGMIRLRDSNDFIDLSTVTNRQSRYREYERLQNMAEIEFAMNAQTNLVLQGKHEFPLLSLEMFPSSGWQRIKPMKSLQFIVGILKKTTSP